ncbi:MAG: BrnT family toxin [Patescibacteria group bacterium]
MDIDFEKLDGFEWDQSNLEHTRRHDVEKEECEQVFLNKPIFINKDETHSQKEERFRLYGRTDNLRLIILIFTIRDKKIRVVSARDQSKKEREEFRRKGGEDL